MTRLISPLVPTLLPTDTGSKAMELMEENKLTELPVVVDEMFVALVKEDDLIDMDDPETALQDTGLLLTYKPAIPASAHPYEALRLMTQMELDVLPIVTFEQKYIGAITGATMLKYIADGSSIEVAGGIIVLEMEARNYSLYEIARICENEDVTIMNSQVYTTPEGTMEVTIKTNRTALEAVVSSLERHDYRIKEVFGDQKNMEDVMGKYNLLMNYLNM
ncbi:CBS domain-containing protein [Flavipsychrobacter stenotrophus]|nr:CBS domain-containing protein [Flavipsychrobacter stenotrophus]